MPNSMASLPNPQSFDTPSDAVGAVVDRVTGLMWQRDLGDKLATFAGAKEQCDALSLAGQDDWRLPTRIELVSILDVTRIEPAIDLSAFPQTPSDWFWTASVAADDPRAAWYVYFYFGYPKTDSVANSFSVRCVRTNDARAVLPVHYEVMSDTVHDLGTGLIWERALSARGFDFDEARAYCSALTVDNQTGWRVPSVVELLTLIDERASSAPMIDALAFPDTPADRFWSSTEFDGRPGQAWHVYFDHGSALYGLPNEQLRVRCVR